MPYVQKKSLIQTDTFYNIQYQRLIKEARIWNNMGQYWLGRDAQRRADALLNSNIPEYQKVKHSNELFWKTKKFK
tara:strand:+ start:293 stop:517 length:225 start_codon:yes stop_codon:yes gene_type:complete